jgi:hypothetical protein
MMRTRGRSSQSEARTHTHKDPFVPEDSLDAQATRTKFVRPPGGEYVVGGSDSYNYPLIERDEEEVVSLRRAIDRAVQEAISGGEAFWRSIEAAALSDSEYDSDVGFTVAHTPTTEDPTGQTGDPLAIELERYASLLDRKMLTEKEFGQLKKRLLRKYQSQEGDNRPKKRPKRDRQ